MKVDLSKWGPLTVIIVLLVSLPVLAGAVLVIVHPETLSFSEFLDDVPKFAVALAVLAGAHGLLGLGQKVAAGQTLAAAQHKDAIVAALEPEPAPQQTAASDRLADLAASYAKDAWPEPEEEKADDSIAEELTPTKGYDPKEDVGNARAMRAAGIKRPGDKA